MLALSSKAAIAAQPQQAARPAARSAARVQTVAFFGKKVRAGGARRKAGGCCGALARVRLGQGRGWGGRAGRRMARATPERARGAGQPCLRAGEKREAGRRRL